MPPKQQSKVDLAKKQKIVEDKTFGLKNKNKSKNVQKYVQSLKQNVQPQPDPSKLAAKVIYNSNPPKYRFFALINRCCEKSFNFESSESSDILCVFEFQL